MTALEIANKIYNTVLKYGNYEFKMFDKFGNEYVVNKIFVEDSYSYGNERGTVSRYVKVSIDRKDGNRGEVY